jgi:hypothetical protein
VSCDRILLVSPAVIAHTVQCCSETFNLKTFLIVSVESMPHKIPKSKLLNERARHKMWQFTSLLTPTDRIREDINWIVTLTQA